VRQQDWTESDNRQGQGQGQGQGCAAFQWIGAGWAHKRDPVGSGRLANSVIRSTGKEHKQTDRRAGTDSTSTPQEDKAPGFLLCLKGHDITGGSVNGRGEGNRRREKGVSHPSIEGTRSGEDRSRGAQGTTLSL